MIEIVFGESACGSLKIAQTYGKGKYRGSAVSIFMRHEDGSVPSSDEMKKAQLQAQEQERIAWENAIPLGGKSCDVYCFDMALSVGDISDNGIGVLICYDVEFPELSRLMADQGMQILFVPFLTDTQNAYSRVRVCAQARAIENECFVVIAGSVGNLPRVHNMDIQYAQSGVFTPCDFAFPTDGKRAEATPNTEMILVSDVDLDLLNELHTYGSVRNLKDRRNDVYEVRFKK